jgi:hypothetical protein
MVPRRPELHVVGDRLDTLKNEFMEAEEEVRERRVAAGHDPPT